MDFTNILQRQELKEKVKNLIVSYKITDNVKKNILIHGECGVGKSYFIKNIMDELGYDTILYDNTDVRNKATIEGISNGNISNQSVIDMFHKLKKKIVIIIDDVESMNNGDKSGLNMLIKVVRPKKTKKQKNEETSLNQIICIANSIVDKKIKELSNACIIIKLPTPTKIQMQNIIQLMMPKVEFHNEILNIVQSDMKKLNTIYNLYLNDALNTCLHIRPNYSNDEAKIYTKNIINMNYKTNYALSELDRTMIGLLWHENIIDVLETMPKNLAKKMYIEFMKNICFADYIDKFIFQKQIWQLNELSFAIKVFKNMNLYESYFPKAKIGEVRFTKILTKYSTEYNNYMFIRNICQLLFLDTKDMYAYFLKLREKNTVEEIVVLMEQYDITQLEVNRVYKFIDRLKDGNLEED